MGEACDQHPNILKTRECGLQDSLKTSIDEFTSCAFITPTPNVEGVSQTIS